MTNTLELVPEDWQRGMARATGPSIGVDAAVSFELVPL